MKCYKKIGIDVLLGLFLCMISVNVYASDRKAGVESGRNVYLHPSGVAIWGCNEYLCSGKIAENGEIYNVACEVQTSSPIRHVAMYGTDIFVGNEDGIFRINLDDLLEGQASPLKIYDKTLVDGFEIYGGYIFFRYGASIYCISVDGDEIYRIAENTSSMFVTCDGLYYANVDGGLYFMGFDNTSSEFLIDTLPKTRITIWKDDIYFRAEEDNTFYSYNLNDGAIYRLNPTQDVRDKRDFWVNDSYLLYLSEDFEVLRVNLQTGDNMILNSLDTIPYHDEGIWNGNMFYYSDEDILRVTDIKNDLNYDINMAEMLTSPKRVLNDVEIVQPEKENGSADSNAMHPKSAPALDNTTYEYNISENLSIHASNGNAIIESRYVYIYAPADIPWDIEVIDNTTFKIYYVPARESGIDGHVVTIQAYDWSDESYMEYPEWQMAYMTANKKYVAIYPTDVQFDINNPVQKDEYMRMLSWAKRMDYETYTNDNPFYATD